MNSKRPNPAAAATVREDAIMVLAQSEESRAKFARMIHDDLAQKLTVMSLELALWKDTLGGAAAPVSEVKDKLAELSGVLNGALASVRDISASIWPRTLETFGFAAAVESAVKRFGQGAGTEIYFDAGDERADMPIISAIHLVRVMEAVLASCVPARIKKLSVVLRQEGNAMRVRLSADKSFSELPRHAAARLRICGGRVIRRGTALTIYFPMS